MDITHTEIIEVLAGRTGYGNASTSEYRTKAIRALNNALRRLYQNKFQFQRRSLMFNLVANQINYTNTDTSIIAPDSVKVTTRANRIQSATTWMLDTAGDFTGSVDSALGDDVGDGSVMQIGDNMYEVESYSGDGTTADDIELNYAAASGSIYFVTDSDEGDRGTRTLLPGSYDQIYQYPAKNDRNCPRYFHVESYASTGSTYGQKIYIGDPTPDDTYLVEMWGYFEPTEVTTLKPNRYRYPRSPVPSRPHY